MKRPHGRCVRAGLALAGWALAGLALLGVSACGDVPVDRPEPAAFRAHRDTFEIDRHDGKGWRPFFVNAVNLAIAKPGYFPGELHAATRDDYWRWLTDIAAMNATAIRTYTLHMPLFYQTFRDWNRAHAGTPVYLIQGVWPDEIEHGDYITDATPQLDAETRLVVDAVHGKADIPPRFGKAYGIYTADASPWLMAWLPGHEMDGALAKAGDAKWAEYTTYAGRFIRMKQGKPMEGWAARVLDHTVAYEWDRWGAMHMVGYSNWPALDPIHHPTETPNFGQDIVDEDLGKFEIVAPFDRGVFVSYHVYPFNPEFIIYDPQYRNTKDSAGKPNSYLGYLKDLKAAHKDIPLLVAEFGVPSSFGVAHVNETAWDHGGYNEAEQAAVTVDLYRAIRQSGAAGAVVFEWIDEWFKRTWVTTPTMLPADRGPFWHDVCSPEESFGIVAYYPIPGWSKFVDGRGDDWKATDFRVGSQSAPPLQPAGDGKDADRTLTGLTLAADPAFLFAKIDLATTNVPDPDATVWALAVSTVDGATGNAKVNLLGLAAQGVGFESLVVLDRPKTGFVVLTDATYDPMPRLNGDSQKGGVPLANSSGVFQLTEQMVNNNAQYQASGLINPKRKFFARGRLRAGDQTKDSLAHVLPGRGFIEVRIPWHALWVTDPSSRHVLFDDPATQGAFDARKTSGVQVFAVAARRAADGTLQIVDVLPRGAFASGTVDGAKLPLYAWPTWDKVVPTERKKPLYATLRSLFAEAAP
ncbi:MAG: hypothetical protein EXR79_13065 [Myxococcales bacterium]|nr:hypothetical protein [Myxococcales bacterium]